MFLFVFLDHVFLLHIQLALVFPVHHYVLHVKKKVLCLRIMSCMSPFPTPGLRNTSHVLALSIKGILNILLRNQCSAASKFFIIPLLNVHVSHPYSIIKIIIFITYYNGTLFTKAIQFYIHTKKNIYNSIIIILYKYILTIETFLCLLEQKNLQSLCKYIVL